MDNYQLTTHTSRANSAQNSELETLAATDPLTMSANTAGTQSAQTSTVSILARQSLSQFSEIISDIEEALTAYHDGKNVSLEVVLHHVSRMAVDGHASTLELISMLNREGVI